MHRAVASPHACRVLAGRHPRARWRPAGGPGHVRGAGLPDQRARRGRRSARGRRGGGRLLRHADWVWVCTYAETALTECGLAQGLISTQVVNRREWLDAVAREDPLERTSFAPHLLVIERMVIANPRWIWCPDRLVRQRRGTTGPTGYAEYAYLGAVLGDTEP